MDQQTRKIPPSEWNRWQDIISSLARQEDNTLKKVVSIMKDEHGFEASISQYESQFRFWNLRKNLNMTEWADAFDIVDRLKSQHKDARILHSDKLVEPAKIQRLRRRYNKMKHRDQKRTMQALLASLRNASIEVRGHDGIWIPYSNADTLVDHAHNEASDDDTLLFASAIGNPTADKSLSVAHEPYSNVHLNAVYSTFSTGAPLFSHISHISNSQTFDGDEPWRILPDDPLNQQLLQHGGSMFSDVGFQSPSSWDMLDWLIPPNQLFMPVPPEFLTRVGEDLTPSPFKQLIKYLGVPGNRSMQRSHHQASTHFSAVPCQIRRFQDDILSARRNDVTQNDMGLPNETYLWASLRSLLPQIDLQGCRHGGGRSMSEAEMLQTNLVPMLLYSTTNGFAMLEDIPIQSVLKYLGRCVNADLLLKACHGHTGKAMAENLFRAAIEAKDKIVLKRLLAHTSIEVNLVVCMVGGRKYTPIERAVSLLDLGMVQLLLDAGADVNKLFDLDASFGGILWNLVRSVQYKERASPNIIEIGKLLLQAKAPVKLPFIRHVLEHHDLLELAPSFIFSLSDSDHSVFIRSGLLSSIALHLDDWEATQATKNIIMACERTNCQSCRMRYEGKLDWALIQGAKRGHVELVKVLLLHSKTPHRALSGAIRAGKSELIDIILTLKPDINAPAHSIDDEFWHSDSGTITTSYAEAIEARNDILIAEMERKGALDLLSDGRRFGPAITATSKIGDTARVEELLRHCCSPKPSHMTRALLCAIQNGHEEIFRTLLAAGADVNSGPTAGSHCAPDPLFAAMLRRNYSMVSAILNADVRDIEHKSYIHDGVQKDVLTEAFKWGDTTIIKGILSVFPSICTRDVEGGSLLKDLSIAQLELMLEYGVVSSFGLTHLLLIGIRRGDTKFVEHLMERGANPTDRLVLTECVRDYPAMLPLIFKHLPSRKRDFVVPGFATDALMISIAGGRAGLKAMDLLLGIGIVDVNRCKLTTVQNLLTSATPLGLACRLSRKGPHNDFEAIRKLLDYGCDPNSIATLEYPNIAQTALLEAIDTRSTDLVRLLINNGAQIEQEAIWGLKRTPLQKAIEVDSLEIVTMLLEMRANVNAKPAERGGATSFQLAAIRGNCVIAAKLLEHGADMHAPPSQVNGRWPLEGAAENGRISMIYFLWGLSKDFFTAERCKRAMELAEENGFMACKDAIAELSQERLATLPSLDFY